MQREAIIPRAEPIWDAHEGCPKVREVNSDADDLDPAKSKFLHSLEIIARKGIS